MKMKKAVLCVGAFVAICMAMPAAAATFLVNFNSPKFISAGPFSGSMTLTTTDIAAADGSYAIIGITGSGIYKTKTYIFSGPILDDGASNKIFADRTGQVFDIPGTSFSMTSGSSKLTGNIFYYKSTTNSYMWEVGSDNGIINSFAIQKMASAVPEPETWAMLLLGFGIIGATLRYRRRPATITYGPPAGGFC
ncbi:PEPxxWA-CTERM sorting domain-containing protein [Sphingomonas sp. M1-B02]|uniref:PEPxxWA-CTERM sorting domain-containing protein n=1 Tax=Sphingomonas sp. M1-B02 TaxID=3114300 RepID=UPI0022403DD9|nr:PEPxxWA-CTERM sorting domain-containing protein [Sphingomonas sp. S6-11]UZK67783.1 PEPxxWA-CTERM sorting domain-containing protein [Sphingomonas sp. S6-11]